MKVSVIIPHYNDPAALDCCLAALQRQSFPADDREIIVADNASPQGKAAIEKIIAGRARLVIVSAKGAGPARNGGVAISSGEILAFTDADCEPEPHWLENGMRALARCDFLGGQVKVLVPDPGHMTPSEAFERVFAFDTASYVGRKGFVATCNLFCSRRVFDAVGPFGVGFSEDIEWSHRATGMNFRIGYAEDAIVGHPARSTWGALKNKWIRINKEIYTLTAQKPAGGLKWLLLCLALPTSAAVHSVKVLRSGQIRGMRQRTDAMFVLYRLRFWRFFDCLRLLICSPRV